MHFSNIGTLQLYYPLLSENNYKQQASARASGSSDGRNQVDGNLTGMTTINSYSIITSGFSIVRNTMDYRCQQPAWKGEWGYSLYGNDFFFG